MTSVNMGAGLSLGLSLSAAGGEAGRDRVLGESGDLGDGEGERVADLIGDGNAGWRVDAVLVVVAVAAADEPDEPDEPDVFEQPVTAAATTTAWRNSSGRSSGDRSLDRRCWL